MKNQIELIKGLPSTYWEIISFSENNKNNDQKIQTWNFYYTYQANLINGRYSPGSNSFNIHANCNCELKGKEFNFGTKFISYNGKIIKNRMEGTWKNKNNESGGFIGILLNEGDIEKNKKPKIEEKFYILWYRKAGEWLMSNWSKVVTIINNKISEIATTYTNRCWSCKHEIKSTQHEYKLVEKLISKWHGNKKCKIPNCNYFLCNECHKCLCHPDSPFRYRYNQNRISRKWVKTDRTLSSN